ncbi:OB-fold domain-containing protein [Streptomyces abyssomicinicus]|uniref:OB-fold domain-containing protein n=1 Tax=Streptomyces abyssomicinicus TaxID=574929 RepID=UPI0012500E03|nr:OB-fold domain-containing protein [Streptomyces abyssomicinicus]
MSGRGILAYGAYLPHWRLRRSAIGAALGNGGGKGTRAVASYDEDTTSLGVEAARAALAGRALAPRSVFFATTEPAYRDKTNATAISAALGLGHDVLAADMTGAVRSGTAALLAGLRGDGPDLVVCSDIRTGLPGSGDERDGGDAGAAFVVGAARPGDTAAPLLAEYLGGGSASDEFLDRWRLPEELSSRVWEERFGENAYLPMGERALTAALKATGLTTADLDHVVVTGTHARAVRSFPRTAGIGREKMADTLDATVGNTGAAHPGLLLASVLDDAEADRVIALVVLADGADVLLFRTTGALAAHRPARGVAARIASGHADVPYASFLTWRGHLDRESPRRPEPDRATAPPSHRLGDWKFAFTGSVCACGTRHLPPQRVCVSCEAHDRMTDERLADVRGTVATYTVDHLAFSMAPPVVLAVIDFDGGGRFTCELTDADPATLEVGTRVEMTFRRLYTSGGIHNYFWKARPVSATAEGEQA